MFKNIFYSIAIVALMFSAVGIQNKSFADEFSDKPIFNDILVVENEYLDDIRGTALNPEVLGIAVFDGVSSNNISNGTISGGNIINAGAFSESSGLSTIIQNSGNNVVIQSATILTVNIE